MYLRIAKWRIQRQKVLQEHDQPTGIRLEYQRQQLTIIQERLHNNRKQHKPIANRIGRFEVGDECCDKVRDHLHGEGEGEEEEEEDGEGGGGVEVEGEGVAGGDGGEGGEQGVQEGHEEPGEPVGEVRGAEDVEA